MLWRYPLIGRTSGHSRLLIAPKKWILLHSLQMMQAVQLSECRCVITAQLIVQSCMPFFPQLNFCRTKINTLLCRMEQNLFLNRQKKGPHLNSMFFFFYPCLLNTTVRSLQIQCCVTFIVCISPTRRSLYSHQQSNCAQPQQNIKFNLQYSKLVCQVISYITSKWSACSLPVINREVNTETDTHALTLSLGYYKMSGNNWTDALCVT